MILENLKNKKFTPLSEEDLAKVYGGGWHSIYSNQKMGSPTGSSEGATGDYGYPTFLGIRVGSNGFAQNDTYND